MPEERPWSHFDDAANVRLLLAANLARAFMVLMGAVLVALSAYDLWRATGNGLLAYRWSVVGLGAGVPWLALGILGGRFVRKDGEVSRYCRWMLWGVGIGMLWLVGAGLAALVFGAGSR